MNPLIPAFFAGSLVVVAASVWAAASLLLDKYRADVRAHDAALDAELGEWAEDWCAEHVDPYIAQVEGEDWELWTREMQS